MQFNHWKTMYSELEDISEKYSKMKHKSKMTGIQSKERKAKAKNI